MAIEPVDAVVIGQALNDFGFVGNNTIAGLGLITFGRFWPCDGIWTPSDDPALTTTWVAVPPAVNNLETCIDTDVGD